MTKERLASVKMPQKTADNLEESHFRIFLQNELVRRCQKNPAYSLRAYAKALDCDVSTLSKILRGRRPLGRIAIEKMGSRLGLDPEQVESFIQKRKVAKSALAVTEVPDYQQLALDSFKVISDWYHYAILELMRVDHFKNDPKWIAKTLGISVNEANVAVERLVRIGLLEITADGRWIDQSEGRSTTIGNQFTTSAFRSLQKQVLELAIRALEEVPMDRRDQTSMTMAIDSRLLPEAKEKIKKFRRELAQFLSRSEQRDSVYQLGISLYPLSKENV